MVDGPDTIQLQMILSVEQDEETDKWSVHVRAEPFDTVEEADEWGYWLRNIIAPHLDLMDMWRVMDTEKNVVVGNFPTQEMAEAFIAQLPDEDKSKFTTVRKQ